MKFNGKVIEGENLLHIQLHFEGLRRTIYHLHPENRLELICKEQILEMLRASEDKFNVIVGVKP